MELEKNSKGKHDLQSFTFVGIFTCRCKTTCAELEVSDSKRLEAETAAEGRSTTKQSRALDTCVNVISWFSIFSKFSGISKHVVPFEETDSFNTICSKEHDAATTIFYVESGVFRLM